MKIDGLKTLIFDFGNVIIDIDLVNPIERLKHLMGVEQSFDLWNATPDYFLKYETGIINDEVFINHIIRDAKKNIQARDIILTWNSILKDLPKRRLDMILELRKQYQVILLSNTNALHIVEVRRILLQEYGISDFETQYFDRVYYSYEIKDRKPNHSIYQKVMDQLNHEPKDALFFDDGEWNVIASNRAGLPAILHLPEWDIVEHVQRLNLL